MNESTTGWLTELGRREIALTKALGFDHSETVAVRRQFSHAYKLVQGIRNSYNQSQVKEFNS